MRIEKRKAVVLVAGMFGVVAASAALWNHTWRSTSMDGASDTEKGITFWVTAWESLDGGARVEESGTTYSSLDDALRAFEEEVKSGGTVIERDQSGKGGRLVKVLGEPSSGQGAAEIIMLEGKKVRHINAGALKYALAFERAWFKI